MARVIGSFNTIYLYEYGASAVTAKVIGCTTTDNLTLNTEVVETTDPTSDYVAILPTYKSGNLASDSLLITEAGGITSHATKALLEWQEDGTKLNFEYQFTDGFTTKKINGTCYIVSLNITGAVDQFATCSINLQITGAWQLDL